MISRKSFKIGLLAVISASVLLITAGRLDDWGWDRGKYHTGQFSPNIIDTLNASSTTPHSHANIHSTATASPSDIPIRPELVPPHPGHDPVCDGFPDTSGIFLVMKTGATESFDKIPMQLMTALRCLTDFSIFSDLEQRIAGHHIHDSLNTVHAEARDGNVDFDLYRQQMACAIDQDMCARTVEGSKDAGWNLDKYKNIHMAEKIFRLQPGYDWYVFVDADTYVSWPNLVYMLHRLDPSKERYLGSPTLIGTTPFAHGGSGYVMSGAAMKKFVGENPGVADRFDLRVKNECCGDYMFAVALSETIGITVESIWPTINGEKPSTLPFGPHHWCQAIATMHHMNSEEVSEFWEFERRRYANSQGPLVLKEVYHAFMEPKLVKMREDWDNQSGDWFYIDFDAQDHNWEEDWRAGWAVREENKSELQKKAHESFDDCAQACEEHDECFQFVWQDGVCGMKRSFMLGKPVKKEDEEKKRTKSGWDVVKIKKWVEDQGECKQVVWPDTGPW